jgi:hypothetical protein
MTIYNSIEDLKKWERKSLELSEEDQKIIDNIMKQLHS